MLGAAFLVAIVAVVVWATITAKYDGRCGMCDGPINAGEQIRLVDDEWVCERCAQEVDG